MQNNVCIKKKRRRKEKTTWETFIGLQRENGPNKHSEAEQKLSKLQQSPQWEYQSIICLRGLRNGMVKC